MTEEREEAATGGDARAPLPTVVVGVPRRAAVATVGKGRATAVRDSRPTRASLPKRLVRFFREVVAELRKVIWPTRKELLTYTAVVVVFVRHADARWRCWTSRSPGRHVLFGSADDAARSSG